MAVRSESTVPEVLVGEVVTEPDYDVLLLKLTPEGYQLTLWS